MDVLRNPLTVQAQRSKLEVIGASLKPNIPLDDPRVLTLSRYVHAAPWRFFDRAVATEMLSFLTRQRGANGQDLREVLAASIEQLDTAFATLQQVNGDLRNDLDYVSEDMAALRLCHDYAHPIYVKLCEPVIKGFLLPVAVIARRSRGKSTGDFKLFHVLDEAQRMGLASLGSCCSAKQRNAIAHGSFTVEQGKCTYRDRGWENELSFTGMLDATDRLIAAANGLAYAYECHWLGAEPGVAMPISFLVETLRRIGASPGWDIAGALASTTINDERQLTVFAESTHLDRERVKYDFARTALIANQLAPGFKRIFLSAQRKGRTLAFGGYGTSTLDVIHKKLVKPDLGVAEPSETPDGDGIQFLMGRTMPSALRRVGILGDAFAGQLSAAATARQLGRDWKRPTLRRWEAFPKRGRLAVRATVVIPPWSEFGTYEAVKKQAAGLLWRVVRQVRWKARWSGVLPWLPIGYAEIAVFAADHPRRKLGN